MTDVLISGGGIAGTSLAIFLGRQGVSVELFERGQFPREKPCGEGLMPAGVGVLDRLGLAEAVGGVPFYGVRYHFGDQIAEGRFPRIAGLPASGRGQRRARFDAALFAAAAAAPNVKAHTGARVEAPLLENGRVAGLIVDGQPRRAPLVVAADGIHSPLRHRLGLEVPVRRKRIGMRAHFRLAPGQSQSAWVDSFIYPGFELYVTSLPENELLVAALADAGAVRKHPVVSIEKTFHRWRAIPPQLAARLEGAEQVSDILCSSPLAGRARAGVAPGIVLLGDAAGFLDPSTGGGMTQALVSAELLARHLSPLLVGALHACPDSIGAAPSETLDRALRTFDRARQSYLRDYRFLTAMVLWLADHPLLTERFLALLRSAPPLFTHLIGVSGGVRRLFGMPLARSL